MIDVSYQLCDHAAYQQLDQVRRLLATLINIALDVGSEILALTGFAQTCKDLESRGLS